MAVKRSEEAAGALILWSFILLFFGVIGLLGQLLDPYTFLGSLFYLALGTWLLLKASPALLQRLKNSFSRLKSKIIKKWQQELLSLIESQLSRYAKQKPVSKPKARLELGKLCLVDVGKEEKQLQTSLDLLSSVCLRSANDLARSSCSYLTKYLIDQCYSAVLSIPSSIFSSVKDYLVGEQLQHLVPYSQAWQLLLNKLCRLKRNNKNEIVYTNSNRNRPSMRVKPHSTDLSPCTATSSRYNCNNTDLPYSLAIVLSKQPKHSHLVASLLNLSRLSKDEVFRLSASLLNVARLRSHTFLQIVLAQRLLQIQHFEGKKVMT